MKKRQKNIGLAGLYRKIAEAEKLKRKAMQLEKSFLISELRYRRLFETAQDGILILNAETEKIIDVNPFLNKLLGYSKSELLGKKLWEIGPFKDIEASRFAFKELQEEGYIRYEDLPLQTKDGKRQDVEFISNIYQVGTERIIQCNIRDVTERCKAEEKFKNLVEVAANWIWEVNTEWKYVYVSSKIKDMLGYEANEMLGKTLFSFMPKQEAERVRKIFREKLINKEPFYDLENINRHKDGHLVILETNGVPIFNAQGQLEGYMGIDRNITERKQAEESLRKSEERYRLLVETATDIISTMDMNMHVTYVSPSVTRVLGWTAEEAMARTMKDTYTSASFEVTTRILAEEMAVEKTGQGNPHWSRMLELELFHKDGTAIPVEAHFSFFRDSTGKPVGVFAIARDITERKKAEDERKNLLEQLIRAEKLAAVGELISGVAHEINNPLTGIVGLSELLLREKKENLDEDTRKDLESIYQSSERIRKIVANLLRFARRETPMKKNVAVNEIIDMVLTIRSYELKVRNVEVIKHYQPDLPLVMADSSQLEQVFLNLITNAEYAIHETGKAGTLTIATSLQEKQPEHKKVIIEISNTGVNIPENVFPKLFNPFFTTKPVGKGTGLGLSVSYGIVKEHGGEIHVRNREEGGAVFTIELPISGGGGGRK